MPDYILDVGTRTDKGPRPHNEDSFWTPLRDVMTPSEKGKIYIVSDGVGGRAAGEYASARAVNYTSERYNAAEGEDRAASLEMAITQTNQQIYQEAQEHEERRGMACTITAAVIYEHELIVANVGDSRAYLLHGDKIIQITQDHTWVAEQVRLEIITPEEAVNHKRKNVVTRSLGDQPEVKVDLFPHQLALGDSIILCSDGLTNVVPEAEIAATIWQHPYAQTAADQLVEQAIALGTKDNVTCVIIKLIAPQDETRPISAHLTGNTTAATQELNSSPVIQIGGNKIPPLSLVILILVVVGLLICSFLLGGLRFPFIALPPASLSDDPTASVSQTATPTQENVVISTATDSPTTTPTFKATQTTPTPTATVTPSPTIALITSVGEPNPPRLFSPSEGQVIEEDAAQSLQLLWEIDQALSPNQQFQVFVGTRTGQLLDHGQLRTINTNVQVSALKPGEYRWFVAMVNTDGQYVSRSNNGTFVVVGPTPTPTLTPTQPPASDRITPTHTPTTVPPVTAQIEAIAPVSQATTMGVTTFVWRYDEPLAKNQSFEIAIWRENGIPLGAHDALDDYRQERIIESEPGIYQLDVSVQGAASVAYQDGIYLWAVYLIELDPYRRLETRSMPQFLAYGTVNQGDEKNKNGN